MVNGYRHAGEVTRHLVDWVTSVVPGAPVTVSSLSDEAADRGIEIRLIAAIPRVVPLRPGHRTVALALDYLVTVRLEDPFAEHEAVSNLAFAAQGAPGFELGTDRSVGELCRAIGLVPRAGIQLRTEARRNEVLEDVRPTVQAANGQTEVLLGAA